MLRRYFHKDLLFYDSNLYLRSDGFWRLKEGLIFAPLLSFGEVYCGVYVRHLGTGVDHIARNVPLVRLCNLH